MSRKLGEGYLLPRVSQTFYVLLRGPLRSVSSFPLGSWRWTKCLSVGDESSGNTYSDSTHLPQLTSTRVERLEGSHRRRRKLQCLTRLGGCYSVGSDTRSKVSLGKCGRKSAPDITTVYAVTPILDRGFVTPVSGSLTTPDPGTYE